MLPDVTSYAGRDLELRVTAETCQCDLSTTFGSAAVTNGTYSGERICHQIASETGVT